MNRKIVILTVNKKKNYGFQIAVCSSKVPNCVLKSVFIVIDRYFFLHDFPMWYIKACNFLHSSRVQLEHMFSGLTIISYRNMRVQKLIWFQIFFLLFTKPHFETSNAIWMQWKVHLFMHYRLSQTFSHRRSHTPYNNCNELFLNSIYCRRLPESWSDTGSWQWRTPS